MIDIYESESARYTSHDSPNVVNLARIVQMRILCGYPYPILADLDLDLDVDTKVVSADEDMSQSRNEAPWLTQPTGNWQTKRKSGVEDKEGESNGGFVDEDRPQKNGKCSKRCSWEEGWKQGRTESAL